MNDKLTKVIDILTRCSDTIQADCIATDNQIDHEKLGKNEVFLSAIKELKKLGVNTSYLRDNNLIVASMIYSRYL